MTTTPLISPQQAPPLIATPKRRWSPRSIAILILAWLILQIGGLFTPGLLDDVDSIYIEIAREMLHRHDYVTPYINGIRFFDKPPLMYWMAAGSMHLFGIHDWAARLPLAIAVLALLIAVYALGIRLFADVSPAAHPDRGGFYAALALATSIGPYLYTRFYIPDILLALWMTLAVHLFLIALDRISQRQNRVPHLRDSFIVAKVGNRAERDPLSSPLHSSVISIEGTRVPHSSQSHRDEWAIAPQRDPLSSPLHSSVISIEGTRVPHSSQSHRDERAIAPQRNPLSSPLHSSVISVGGTRVPHPLQSHRKGWGIRASREPLSSPLHSSVISTEGGAFAAAAEKPASLPQLLTSQFFTTSPLLPCLTFAAVMALNVLTKGLIGLVFPIAFVLFYLAITRQLHLLTKFHIIPSTALFLAIAAPWHILAALRTPAIPMPTGLGLPAKAGWAWFYLYNEHFARFLGKRIPHDYGLTPVWLFFLYLAIWIMPWTTFIPSALTNHLRTLWRTTKTRVPHRGLRQGLRRSFIAAKVGNRAERDPLSSPNHEAALALLLWAILVLGFFSISSRQEYYSLPAIPALALMAGGLLARADSSLDRDNRDEDEDVDLQENEDRHFDRTSSFIAAQRRNPLLYRGSPYTNPARSALNWHLYFLLPLTTLIAAICGYFAITAPHAPRGTDISTLLAANPEFYNLSLGHLFDLTGAAMGLFRGPLVAVALSMLTIGIGSYLLRRKGLTYAANLTLAAAMTLTLLAAHEGLSRFYPILGSKSLALSINKVRQPNDLIILDGELTSGSTLIFYTGQQVHLVNGRVNGLWYGSFWPDAPQIFETESTLHQLWSSPRRIFLMTYDPTARTKDLAPYGAVQTLAAAGGKTILTNH